MIPTLLYIVFVLAAIILIVVVLLQEGKGGGLGSALGDHGQQTIGVGAKGINIFTMWVSIAFLGSAIALHLWNRGAADTSAFDGQERSLMESPEVIPGDPSQQPQ